MFVLPMRLGRGIRLKALEAIASGLPLVSTSLGVEGLKLNEGREVLLAETPEDFARQVGAALCEREAPAYARARGTQDRRQAIRLAAHWDWLRFSLGRCDV